MPRKSAGHDSRMITYRSLPGSSTRYQRVNVGECTAWVQTNLEFDLEVQHPDQTAETKPYIISRLTRRPGAPGGPSPWDQAETSPACQKPASA